MLISIRKSQRKPLRLGCPQISLMLIVNTVSVHGDASCNTLRLSAKVSNVCPSLCKLGGKRITLCSECIILRLSRKCTSCHYTYQIFLLVSTAPTAPAPRPATLALSKLVLS